MSPGGSSKRSTGTIPKSRAGRQTKNRNSLENGQVALANNNLPREAVVPTRRQDCRNLQQHLNDFFASVAESSTNLQSSSESGINHQTNGGVSSSSASVKSSSNRTPGEGTCFDLENFQLQDDQRFCWPVVRPIPRRSLLLQENDINEFTSGQNNQHNTGQYLNGITNQAIGVVIPTTPNTSSFNFGNSEESLASTAPTIYQPVAATRHLETNSNILSGFGPISMQRIPDGAPQPSLNPQNNPANLNLVERINQIKEYIKITTNLVNSIQDDNKNRETHKEDLECFEKILSDLRDSELKLILLSEDSDIMEEEKPGVINSTSLDSVHTELSGPRPQSVVSIHSTEPSTPTCDDLQTKLEASQRNMQKIKEQQDQLLQIQNLAKNQLSDMENNRKAQPKMTFNSANGPPDYVNAEDVQNDLGSLMNRMRTLTNFIHNQNELAGMLGPEADPEIEDEQIQLQQKLAELKNRKAQMQNMVSELESMNTQADDQFDQQRGERERTLTRSTNTPVRNVPLEYERIVPIELLNAQGKNSIPPAEPGPSVKNVNSTKPIPPVMRNESFTESENDADNTINGKINEINAMKGQLQRLKDMMDTIKLIELKNNQPIPPPPEEEILPQRDEGPVGDRVQALTSMTQDLREQAISLAAERDRLKSIKNEMIRRRDNPASSADSDSERRVPVVLTGAKRPNNNSDNDSLKDEYEARKKEFENLCGKLENMGIATPNTTTKDSNTGASNAEPLNQWNRPANLSATSSWSGNDRGIENVGKARLRREADQLAKDSCDSGAADIAGTSDGGHSLQSLSSRGYSLPPMMRNISRDNKSLWNKPPMETNGLGLNCSCSPNHQLHANQPAHSPHFYCNEMHGNCCRNFNGQQSSENPLLLQQFIQTQQMLINSMAQCNQLLWDQQREINNLNNAVLLLQERILNNTAASSGDSLASAVGNHSSFQHRAQSEQPYQHSLPPLPPNSNTSRSNGVPLNSMIYGSNYRSSSLSQNLRSGSPLSRDYLHNNYEGLRMSSQPYSCPSNGVGINMMPQCPPSPPVYVHNNATSNGAANNLNNQMPSNNLYGLNKTTTQFNNNLSPALNNQVPPGNRANNYWDNFRSYSRQNLLSSNNFYKNNDDLGHQIPERSRNLISTPHMTYNILPDNKGLQQLRNRISSNMHANPPDVLNLNDQQQSDMHQVPSQPYQQHTQQLQMGEPSYLEHMNNINQSGQNNFNSINCGGYVASCSPSNFEVNEFKPNTPKIMPKLMRYCNMRSNENAIDIDPNLATTSRQDSKSSGKLFESLKENVFQEVSALIAANESRPHFLINLFRELQLISASDPLRNKIMQAFQELYFRNSLETGDGATGINSSVLNAAAQTHSNNMPSSSVGSQASLPLNGRSHFISKGTQSSQPSMVSTDDTNSTTSVLKQILQSVRRLVEDRGLSESTLQRIANFTHNEILALNMRSNEVQYQQLEAIEILEMLRCIDHSTHNNFLVAFEDFLSTLPMQPANNKFGNDLSNSAGSVNILQNHPILDMVFGSSLKSNEVLSALRRSNEEELLNIPPPAQQQNSNDPQPPQATTSTSNNEDLAEADQICVPVIDSREEQHAEGARALSPSIVSSSGNLLNFSGSTQLSSLPDLAKVDLPNGHAEDIDDGDEYQ